MNLAGKESSSSDEWVDVGTLVLGVVAAVGGVVLLSSSGDDSGGVNRLAAALRRIIDAPNSEVTAEDWAAVGIEGDLSASDLTNLATVIEAHPQSDDDDLKVAQARWRS